jgi:hypothetical protein
MVKIGDNDPSMYHEISHSVKMRSLARTITTICGFL